ncbi:hypothetical protein NBRC116583_34890 [Arenicella sp. 4NH20-0111]|uniref:hypothetical protein n=1 Tax=Arenicella sp. 4NH20-0111 TaxID=3127648 RepID=UPI00310850BD
MPRPPSVEQKLRGAFERIKLGTQQNIPQGTKMTMSSVAKEARILPSAFRRERYPEIHREVAAFIEVSTSIDNQSKPKKKRRKSDAKRIKKLNDMVEKLLAMNNSLRDVIDHQQEEIDMLKDGGVVMLRKNE